MSILMWTPKRIGRNVMGSKMMCIDACVVHMILIYIALILQLLVFTMGFKFTIEYQEIVSNLCCIYFLNFSRLCNQGSKCDVPFQSHRTCVPIQMQAANMYGGMIQTMTPFIFCLCPFNTNHEGPLHPEYSRALKEDGQQCRTAFFTLGREIMTLKFFAFKHSFLHLTKIVQIWVKSLEPKSFQKAEVLSQKRIKYLVSGLHFQCVFLRIYRKIDMNQLKPRVTELENYSQEFGPSSLLPGADVVLLNKNIHPAFNGL